MVNQDATFANLFSGLSSRLSAKENSQFSSVERLLEEMDQTGVSRAIVVGIGWTDRELAKESNDYILESAQAHPDRLTGFCSVNPAWGDGGVEEIERCVSFGARGVGELHPDPQGLDITDAKAMAPFMDAARRMSLPILVHASEPVGHQYPGKGTTTPDKLYRLIQNFPDNTIICAHWGGGLPFYMLMPEVPQVLKNVYFDMAASPFLYNPGVVKAVTQLAGPDRILFGTDFPLIRPQRLLAQVEGSGIDQAAKEAILGGNAARLLGL